MSTLTSTNPAGILKDNLEHTIFSWSKQSGLAPLNIERTKGIYLYERSGKRYIDFSSQLMNVNIGHGHPKVAEAVAKQMAEVSYVHPGMITEARGKLGKTLAEITPGSLNRTCSTSPLPRRWSASALRSGWQPSPPRRPARPLPPARHGAAPSAR